MRGDMVECLLESVTAEIFIEQKLNVSGNASGFPAFLNRIGKAFGICYAIGQTTDGRVMVDADRNDVNRAWIAIRSYVSIPGLADRRPEHQEHADQGR